MRREPASRHDWNIMPVPENAERLDFHRVFSAEEHQRLKLGFIPREHDDSFFAYYENDVFAIHYKHTGQLIYRITLTETNGGWEVVETQANYVAMPLIKDEQSAIDWLDGVIDDLLEWIERTERPANAADWKTVPFPEERTQLAINIIITEDRCRELEWGFIPRVMENHWFYFMQDHWLHLHRSWTGFCIYQLRFESTEGGYKVAEAWVNRNPDQYRNRDDQEDIDWIRDFLTGRNQHR